MDHCHQRSQLEVDVEAGKQSGNQPRSESNGNDVEQLVMQKLVCTCTLLYWKANWRNSQGCTRQSWQRGYLYCNTVGWFKTFGLRSVPWKHNGVHCYYAILMHGCKQVNPNCFNLYSIWQHITNTNHQCSETVRIQSTLSGVPKHSNHLKRGP